MAAGQSCKHYQRLCQIVSPCCGLYFNCHHCHNEESARDSTFPHQIDRFLITEIVCRLCGTRQAKAEKCCVCGVCFGRYACLKCAIWEDSTKKSIYHCDKCRLCRVGNKSEFFHCDTCSACLNISQLNNHHCLADTMKNDCPICLEPMFDSVSQCIMMGGCGHMIHQSCWRQDVRLNPDHVNFCLYCRQPTNTPEAVEVTETPQATSTRQANSDSVTDSVIPDGSWAAHGMLNPLPQDSSMFDSDEDEEEDDDDEEEEEVDDDDEDEEEEANDDTGDEGFEDLDESDLSFASYSFERHASSESEASANASDDSEGVADQPAVACSSRSSSETSMSSLASSEESLFMTWNDYCISEIVNDPCGECP